MSYGMPLMGLVAVAVLVAARSWRPLPVAAVAALAVVLGFAAMGFAWWDAYPVLKERYFAGIASDRPQSYWWYGNLACLVVSAGPLLLSGVLAAGATALSAARRSARTVLLLVGAAVVCGRRRRVRDEQGRGRADLAAVRAVADAVVRAAAGAVADAGGSGSRWRRRWWSSTSSTPPGDRSD